LINVNLLPKTMRRRGAPSAWGLAAAAVPLLALLVTASLQLQAHRTAGGLEHARADLKAEKAVLQRFVDEQNERQAHLASLQALQAVAETVRTGRVVWSEQLFAMLETRPPSGPGLGSRISFRGLEMRALDEATRAQRVAENAYEDVAPVAEMDVQGVAGSAQVIADYMRELQRSPRFGVALRDLAREEGSGFYTFNLSIGAAAAPTPQAEVKP